MFEEVRVQPVSPSSPTAVLISHPQTAGLTNSVWEGGDGGGIGMYDHAPWRLRNKTNSLGPEVEGKASIQIQSVVTFK